MWIKIRTFLICVLLNENTLRQIGGACGLDDTKATATAKAIMDIKYFIDTHDKRYLNQAIDELQTLL